ncbi:MAG: T9SS type A sorting domain-containing protein [Bacteroidia bacterium]
MKMELISGLRLLRAVTCILCIMTPIGAWAQDNDPYLERFSLTRDDERVLLNWVTRPGTTCEGVDIMRSVDSTSYEVIYHVPGICGGPDDAFSYSFLDLAPVPNRRNFYRLGLGRLGETHSYGIDVVKLDQSGYQLRPNPVTDLSTLYFDNADRQSCELRIMSMNGVVVSALTTKEEFFSVDASTLRAGLYVFQIRSEDGKALTGGRLLVQH